MLSDRVCNDLKEKVNGSDLKLLYRRQMAEGSIIVSAPNNVSALFIQKKKALVKDEN